MTTKKHGFPTTFDLFTEALFEQIAIAVKDRATETAWEEDYVVSYDGASGSLRVIDRGSLVEKSSVYVYATSGRNSPEFGAFVLDENGYKRYVGRANLDGSIPEPNKHARASEDQTGWKSSPREVIDLIVDFLTAFWREPKPEYCETCPCKDKDKAPDKKK